MSTKCVPAMANQRRVVEASVGGNGQAHIRRFDLREQLPRYRAAGIDEIWLVDPFTQRLRADTRRAGTYQSAVLADGRLDSLVLPGFWIDVDWMWRPTLLSSMQCLRAVVG